MKLGITQLCLSIVKILYKDNIMAHRFTIQLQRKLHVITSVIVAEETEIVMRVKANAVATAVKSDATFQQHKVTHTQSYAIQCM